MTDTGQVPGEGLPENAGGRLGHPPPADVHAPPADAGYIEQPQPGAAPGGAYTFLDAHETGGEEDDLLLMPGAQGAWSEQQAQYQQGGGVPMHEAYEGGVLDPGAAEYADTQLPEPQPVVQQPPGPQPQPQAQPQPVQQQAAQPASAPPPAPATARRPLHMGPSVPDSSGGVVRSLADRGPAAARHAAPVRQPEPPAPEPPAGPEQAAADQPMGPEAVAMPEQPMGAEPTGAPEQPMEPEALAMSEQSMGSQPVAEPEQPMAPEAGAGGAFAAAADYSTAPEYAAGPQYFAAQPEDPAQLPGPQLADVPQPGEAWDSPPPPQPEPAPAPAETVGLAEEPPMPEGPEAWPGPEQFAQPAAPEAQPVAMDPGLVEPEAAEPGDMTQAGATIPAQGGAPVMEPAHVPAPHAAAGADATTAEEPVIGIPAQVQPGPAPEQLDAQPAPAADAVPGIPAQMSHEPLTAPAEPAPAPAAETAPEDEAAEPVEVDPGHSIDAEVADEASAPGAEAEAVETGGEQAPVEAPDAAEEAPQEEAEASPEHEPAVAEEENPEAGAEDETPEAEASEDATTEVAAPEAEVAESEPATAEASETSEEEAAPAEPEATEPEATQPEAEAEAAPEEPEAEATDPEARAPETTEPQATGTEATDAEATEPEATEPEATEPEATEPEATETEGTAPEATAPQATEPVPTPVGPRAEGYDEAERAAVHRVMRERRDIRNGFRSDPVPHEVLLRVLEAAHTAPSVGHSQPWDFVVIRSEDTRRTMHELAMRQREAYAKSLPKGRAKQFKELKIEAILETPVNIVVTADPTRGGRHTLGRHTQPQMAPYSSALAVENLWLAARAEGLGVGWVSFFDEREMVRELGLPEHLEVVAYLCVGYVDEFPEEPELMRSGWSKRRPLAWVVHEETYGRRALPGEDPHNLLQETLQGIRPLDAKALGEAWERQKRMTKPSGALGMLEIISAQLSGLSRQCPPPIPEPAAVAIFAGDHGVHAQGVTAWPQEVTSQMVANFLGGGAVCNAFASQVGAEVCVVDVGVASELPSTPGLLPRKVRAGTGDFTTGPALTREEVLRAIEVGIETARDLVAAGNKALLTGEMGIANTTVSAALVSVYTGADPAEVTGRGTGINDEMHARKIDVVRRGLELHQPDPADPIGVLSALGGLEHAAIAGLLLGGASLRTPVILDGVSAGAAALVARAIAPEVLAACIAGHRSAEPGHVAALNKLGLRPLVDLDLRLGEGTGALLALPVVQSAARAMHEVATFDSAGVTEKN